MKIGYARTSSDEQGLALQRKLLRAAGCTRIFEDAASFPKQDWPGLAQALSRARKGDELVVWRLDRVGRSLSHLVQFLAELRAKGVEFRTLTENIATSSTSTAGAAEVFAALTEFERDLARARTSKGRAARARGRKGGRPPLPADKVALLRQMWDSRALTAAEIADQLGIHRSTVFRYGNQTQEENAK